MIQPLGREKMNLNVIAGLFSNFDAQTDSPPKVHLLAILNERRDINVAVWVHSASDLRAKQISHSHHDLSINRRDRCFGPFFDQIIAVNH